jgi:uncharacterized membrane protein HdeD (DUF308 family)
MTIVTNKDLSKGWKWFIGVGVITALAGILAISLPIAAGITLTKLMGIAFLVIGFIQVFHSLNISLWKTKVWYVISAVFYLLGGWFILWEPFVSLITLTALMIITMMFSGVSRIIFAFINRNLNGWNGIALSGAISVLVSGYFLSMMSAPEFSTSLLGIFVGVSLLFEGISFVIIGRQLKNI